MIEPEEIAKWEESPLSILQGKPHLRSRNGLPLEKASPHLLAPQASRSMSAQ
jgi:hypothetical protein